MPKIRYKHIKMSPERRGLVDQAVSLIQLYSSQGYQLTLRQLYYQFVARDLLPATWADPKTGSTNNEKSYGKLGDVISDARMAGLIDWTAIEDRTRNLEKNSHWDSPADIIDVCSRSFQIDKWIDQPYRIEVWVEKDALEGVVAKAARALDVSYFSCRGYASMTALWEAGQRLKGFAMEGQTPVILHLGDHDPSGIDMSRDIQERVSLFMDSYSGDLEFERLALNMDQVQQYNPPPNPAKASDARYADYVNNYGEECWELDALEPSVIEDLIRDAVLARQDGDKWDDRVKEETNHKHNLKTAAEHWDEEVATLLTEIQDNA